MRMRSRYLPVSILVLSLVISVFLLAPAITGDQFASGSTGATGWRLERPRSVPVVPDQPPEPRPYDRVITKEAKSDEGIFTVHTIKEKIYYEIPKSELDERVSLGEPDCQDNARRWLWRSGCRQSSGEMGAQGQSHSAAKCRLRRCRRSETARCRARSRRQTTTRSSWRSISRRSAKTTRP